MLPNPRPANIPCLFQFPPSLEPHLAPYDHHHRAQQNFASSLPGMASDHPAIVRFGRVRWAVQPAVLRQQIYACGCSAWDASPGLFPSITDITLQNDDHEFAELTFPSGSLAADHPPRLQYADARAMHMPRMPAPARSLGCVPLASSETRTTPLLGSP
ncbi:hypothetical protein C8T65DRAFT_654276 [Cerioporus squamosus]|nr:hypothetical protein C8T65DRAFT_654276 [Cerioporus squamosus]